MAVIEHIEEFLGAPDLSFYDTRKVMKRKSRMCAVKLTKGMQINHMGEITVLPLLQSLGRKLYKYK